MEPMNKRLSYRDYVEKLGQARAKLREVESLIGTNADERKRIAAHNPLGSDEHEHVLFKIREQQVSVDLWQGEIDIAHHELREREIAARDHLADALFALSAPRASSPFPEDRPLRKGRFIGTVVAGVEAAT